MAQHDYNIANQGFPAFRTDLNNALSAIQTTNSGTSRPTGAVAGQLWLDTTSATSPTLKYYDGADDISLATLDHTGNTVNWLDSTVSVTGLSTTATGTVLTLTDSVTTSTVNLIIDNQKEIRFRETTANGTNYVALKAPASVSADLTFTLPATDGTSGQVLQTNGSGVLSFGTAGGGKVLQVVSTNKQDTFSQSSTSTFVDITGLSVTITPSATANKILVICNISYGGSANDIGAAFRLVRNSTAIGGGTASGSRQSGITAANAKYNSRFDTANFNFLDSPSTTSSTTYKVQMICDVSIGGRTAYINRTGQDTDDNSEDNARLSSTITVMEIAG
jgi:hypothetical protein